MKSKLFFFISIFVTVSCAKQSAYVEPAADKWNGYGEFLKSGEQVHTLWAGQNINAGTVTYGIDENANFYVTYDCSTTGWQISESHMYAGIKASMPLNKPGAPKIGLFPNSATHDPCVSVFTYSIPLSQLPPCEAPGFVVASHCVVHSPAGSIETAWAEGDYTFSDKGWGWYDDYYYTQGLEPATILYGTTQHLDSLLLYHIDVISGETDLLLKEHVGNTSAYFDGAAYDYQSGMFFFTNYTTGELWVNNLQGDEPSFIAGTLSGIAASGTFYNGGYYYVNENFNTINLVTFTTEWAIACETVLDTIPGIIFVKDIAMDPAGDYLYIMGMCNYSGMELLSWEVSSHTFYSMSVSINAGAQISFGSDGLLYAIAPVAEGTGISSVFVVDTGSGVLQEISSSALIVIDDPLSDVAMGPGL